MGRPMVRISPLRLWLQSTSLLAVLAGYSLLLLADQTLTRVQENANHRSLVEQLVVAAQSRAQSQAELEKLVQAGWHPNLELALLQSDVKGSSQTAATRIRRVDGEWMLSRAPLSLTDGSRAVLLIAQKMTGTVRQEQLSFWLLVVAIGLASLFTSCLLRLVLRRGLVLPLEEFTSQLQATQSPPAPEDCIDVAAQPEELQPIAIAFNDLQDRLRISWTRERAFVDGVAHELRTPITLIGGHTERLLRSPEIPHNTSSLRLIHKEARRMTSLVSDLLDLARSDAGRLTLQRRPIIGDDALLELFERMAPKAGGRLRLQDGNHTDGQILIGLGDPDRLQQCLTALVDNALQYSPVPQPITLACSSSPSGELVLHVRDRGPGVAEEERGAIFERFVRGQAGIRSEARGSGIGLSMVQLLMEAMGGFARVTATPGGGADFQLVLPPDSRAFVCDEAVPT